MTYRPMKLIPTPGNIDIGSAGRAGILFRKKRREVRVPRRPIVTVM